MQQEKIIVIDVHLNKGLLWILVTIALISAVLLYLTLAESPAEASFQAQATGQRQYYLSQSLVHGNQAETACAAGYHFASLWEIADPSNLLYNTTLGKTYNDSGTGPAAATIGWVRTGYIASVSSTAGLGNCHGWTSYSGSDYGTAAALPDAWTNNAEDLGVWDLTAHDCFEFVYVWCIED